jgi:hypothetical protein
MPYNVPAVANPRFDDGLAARIRALRSIASTGGATRADKLCRSNGVGIFPSEAGARNDLGIAEAEPPTGGEVYTVLLCAVRPFIYFPIS